MSSPHVLKKESEQHFLKHSSAHIQMDQGTRIHETLFASTEGRMLGVGLMLLAFGIGWHLYPDRILPYAIMTGLNLITGREGRMSFGNASGFGHDQVVPLNILRIHRAAVSRGGVHLSSRIRRALRG